MYSWLLSIIIVSFQFRLSFMVAMTGMIARAYFNAIFVSAVFSKYKCEQGVRLFIA